MNAVIGSRNRNLARRRLLRFLLQSPLLSAPAFLASSRVLARPEFAIPEVLDDVLDVFQMKRLAQKTLDPESWHFIVNGADDMRTVEANRQAFNAWQLRVRRLVDVSAVDTSVQLLGQELPTPILLAPAGAQGTIHPDGELATMRAASARGHLLIVSTISSNSVGEIRETGNAPLWFQLYPSPDQGLMRHLLGAAEAAGCLAVALTVDSPTRGNREGERWFSRRSTRQGPPRMGNFEAYQGPPRIGDSALTWAIVDWLRANTRLPVFLKGIVTREDAALAVRERVDGLIVSNHGGRQEESGRGTLECLPEVVAEVAGRMPVLIDGGFRRGTDIFKALALGADAVCIGRPYLYGLGAFGEQGVAKVLAILDSEFKRCMQLAGTVRVSAIKPACVQRQPG
ncbi:MAG: alpha-hydroxy-acid oxidizing protein [Gammaproteobacteria bacterium]|nr:alpha-hydroxy-acid oxidizing protein [Gammaproteobacteria bacterium]MDH5275920.1 alpha-hydroxy-acid oxidizing protein [Gammaproteobacteria bacterium]